MRLPGRVSTCMTPAPMLRKMDCLACSVLKECISPWPANFHTWSWRKQRKTGWHELWVSLLPFSHQPIVLIYYFIMQSLPLRLSSVQIILYKTSFFSLSKDTQFKITDTQDIAQRIDVSSLCCHFSHFINKSKLNTCIEGRKTIGQWLKW